MTQNRFLKIQHGYNFRDLGGYPTKDGLVTKWHKVVRSGDLAHLTPAEQIYLRNYGVICDVDLRSKAETEKYPDRVPKGIKYIFNPIRGNRKTAPLSTLKTTYSKDPQIGYRHMIWMYHNMASVPRESYYYRRLFKIFLEDGPHGAVLFHCVQGKDRTGWGAILFLLVLGVDLKTVKQDYLISAKVMVPYIKMMQDLYRPYHVNANFMANIKSLYTVSSDFFEAGFQRLHENYGTWANFERDYLHLDQAKIKQLKEIYLERP